MHTLAMLLLLLTPLLLGSPAHADGVSDFLQWMNPSSAGTEPAAPAAIPTTAASTDKKATRSPKIYMYNVSEKFRESHEAWNWQHTALYGLEIVRAPGV
jgi:hypothetical protein